MFKVFYAWLEVAFNIHGARSAMESEHFDWEVANAVSQAMEASAHRDLGVMVDGHEVSMGLLARSPELVLGGTDVFVWLEDGRAFQLYC